MRDKLTKKRIKVDYEAMIIYLHLDADFVRYIFQKNSKISSRRSGLAFLLTKKVDIESVYYEMKAKGLQIDDDKSQKMLEIAPFKEDSSNKLDEKCDSCHDFKDNSDWLLVKVPKNRRSNNG